jgi:hypothetical protein
MGSKARIKDPLPEYGRRHRGDNRWQVKGGSKKTNAFCGFIQQHGQKQGSDQGERDAEDGIYRRHFQ